MSPGTEEELRQVMKGRVDPLSIEAPAWSTIVERASRDAVARTRRQRVLVVVGVLAVLVVAGSVAVARNGDRVVRVGGQPPGTSAAPTGPPGTGSVPPYPTPQSLVVPAVRAPGTAPASIPGAEVADARRILLDGWAMSYYLANPESSGGAAGEPFTYVEYHFEQGGQKLQVSFYPSGTRIEKGSSVDLRGTSGQLLPYGGGRFRVDWNEGGFDWEADGGPFADQAAFLATVSSLHAADAASWQAAMPAGTVSPSARAAAVDRLLVDVPIPPGLDVEALRRSDQPASAYQLGVEVLGKGVACAWLEDWEKNKGTPAADDAVKALAGSVHWQGLIDMQADGGYPSAVWGYATQVATGSTAVVDYRNGLGCL